jgi:hypothetical protein
MDIRTCSSEKGLHVLHVALEKVSSKWQSLETASLLNWGKKTNQPCWLGGGSNEDTSNNLLDGCVCCSNITLWVSASLLVGNTRTTTYSEMVDHSFIFIEELIGCGMFTYHVNEFIDWEDREDLNGIADGIISELRWDPCMEKHGISYSIK